MKRQGERQVLLYGAAVSAIGFMCAMVFRWPAMVGVAALLAALAFVFDLSEGTSLGHALLSSALSLFLLQSFYVIGGFVTSFRLGKFSAKKKNIEA